MCKWLAILLLVLMPLQLSWAAVGAYCQHERGQAASHAGHHTHEHQSQAESDVPAGEKGVMPSADADCVTCHAGCVLWAMPSHHDPVRVLPPVIRSADPGAALVAPTAARPERPQWNFASLP
jgi:hypothetical protein